MCLLGDNNQQLLGSDFYVAIYNWTQAFSLVQQAPSPITYLSKQIFLKKKKGGQRNIVNKANEIHIHGRMVKDDVLQKQKDMTKERVSRVNQS